MKSLIRTPYGIYLQNALYSGLPYSMIPNTTLNEKLSILAGVAPPQNAYPQLKYFCIGNGGHQMAIGANNIPKHVPTQHLATDASLFKPMPFILREPQNDLIPQERALYALRREEQYNGKTFIAYYLRRIDYSLARVEMTLFTVDEKGNRLQEEPFVPDARNLNPTPQTLSSSGLNVIKGQYVSVETKIDLAFNPEQAAELRNVANIMYADEELAIVSEVGLVSGLDRNIQLTNSSTFKEVIAAQICHIAHTAHSAFAEDLGFKMAMSVAATEPLFKLDKAAINGITGTPNQPGGSGGNSPQPGNPPVNPGP